MQPLNYIVNWRGDKEKAWSGTNYSLFKALSKLYDVRDYDYYSTSLFRKLICKALPAYTTMEMYDIRNAHKRFKSLTGPTFQFAEMVDDKPGRPTYIYQDLSCEHLVNLRQSDTTVFHYSGFDRVPFKALSRRNEMQQAYYKTAHGMLTMGKWLAEEMKALHPDRADKIFHVGGGVNLNVNNIKPENKNRKRILFVGRDYKRKGGDKVIEAFQILRQSIPDLELHFAGPTQNPMPQDVPGFYFYGDASKDVVENLMNKCDVFCMPSYFEAYGLVFIEALTFGLPCIGRNRYEMPYLIEEGVTGELVYTDEAEELANKIKQVLTAEHYYENVKSKRNEYIDNFSWDAVASRIFKIISAQHNN